MRTGTMGKTEAESRKGGSTEGFPLSLMDFNGKVKALAREFRYGDFEAFLFQRIVYS